VSVAQKTENQREACETIGGGTLVVMDGPNGSNTTECKGGTGDGDTCFNTATSVKCQTGDHDPSNASGSSHDQNVFWQDVVGTEQTAPLGTVAGGTYQTPLYSEVQSVSAEPAATPVIDPIEGADEEPLVADSETTSLPEDVSDETAPDVVVDEPFVADSSTDGALGDATIYVEQVDSYDDGLYFLDYEQE
jgi:hypothetical protein